MSDPATMPADPVLLAVEGVPQEGAPLASVGPPVDVPMEQPVAAPAEEMNLFEDDHLALPALAVHVSQDAGGLTHVRALDPDGVEHLISITSNHGMLIAFKVAILDMLQRLGDRAASWEKQAPLPAQAPEQEG